MADYWKPTSDMFSGLIDKPKMTEKLLSKPPFKYIFDIIIETSKKTNFARGTLSVTFRTLQRAITQRRLL
jgi:hypothetical protein